MREVEKMVLRMAVYSVAVLLVALAAGFDMASASFVMTAFWATFTAFEVVITVRQRSEADSAEKPKRFVSDFFDRPAEREELMRDAKEVRTADLTSPDLGQTDPREFYREYNNPGHLRRGRHNR